MEVALEGLDLIRQICRGNDSEILAGHVRRSCSQIVDDKN